MIVIISQLRCFFLTFAGQSFNIFNRFACFWPKGYQLGSLGKSHQNGDYLKEAMQKIVFPQESNQQWTGNPKAAGSIPVGRQFFALLLLSSRRSGGSSLGFRAGSL